MALSGAHSRTVGTPKRVPVRVRVSFTVRVRVSYSFRVRTIMELVMEFQHSKFILEF